MSRPPTTERKMAGIMGAVNRSEYCDSLMASISMSSVPSGEAWYWA